MTTKTMRSYNPHAKHSPRGGPGAKFKPAEKPMSFDAFKKKKCVLLRSEISTEGYGESEIYYACFLALNPEVWLVKHYGRRTGRVNKRATIKSAMDAEAAYKRYTDEFKAGKYFVKINNSEMYSDNAIAEAKRLGVLPSLGELKGTELKAPKQHAQMGGLRSQRKKTGESEKKLVVIKRAGYTVKPATQTYWINKKDRYDGKFNKARGCLNEACIRVFVNSVIYRRRDRSAVRVQPDFYDDSDARTRSLSILLSCVEIPRRSGNDKGLDIVHRVYCRRRNHFMGITDFSERRDGRRGRNGILEAT